MARLKKAALLGAMATLLSAAPAAAIGTLVGPDGSTIPLDASRTLLVRYADRIQLITQIKYEGRPGEFDWLIALPNVNNAIDNGVRVSMASQAMLDELANTTHPVLDGACDGNPTGARAEVYQVDGDWGPTANEALPARIFEATQIQNGDLDNYLTGTRGYTIDDALRGAIDDTFNQNYMFAAVHIDTAAVGVDKIDPIVSITWPDAGDTMALGTRPIAASIQEGGKADLVLWTLDAGRVSGNFATRELDFSAVEFLGVGQTNYLLKFDDDVGRNQTQAFITEYGQPVSAASFESELLETLRSESGATFLTRLRARMLPAVFRTNAKTMTFTAQGAAAYENTHEVIGLMCGGDVPDMGGVEADMGEATADMGTELDEGPANTADAGSASSGGGGSDGCAVSADTPAWPLLLGALPLLISLRRRRR
jgi:hypothetical protein